MASNNKVNHQSSKPLGPYNLYTNFIGPNPPTSFNPVSKYPCIDQTAFIGPFSTVIGDVTISQNVFLAPNVTIRADEGTPFFIGANTNLQDGVILHGLKDGIVIANGKKYSIFIGEHVSCAHGCLIHGPCLLGNNVFVGFKAIVYYAIVNDGCFISSNAVVTGGVTLAPNKLVPPGSLIDTQAKADALGSVPAKDVAFAQGVQQVNIEFPADYTATFGSIRCSCGITCNYGTSDL